MHTRRARRQQHSVLGVLLGDAFLIIAVEGLEPGLVDRLDRGDVGGAVAGDGIAGTQGKNANE